MTDRDDDQPAATAALASRVLARSGQADMVWGHVSLRDPHGRGIWIKAPGWGLDEVLPDRVQLVSFEAEVLLGHGAPHKECHIHLEVLRSRPDLQSVVHTHAEAAISFAALGVPLLPISHDAALFGGKDVPRFDRSGALVSTPDRGAALARILGDEPAALMPSHGLVAAGTSVPAAVMHAVLLHRACRMQLAAAAAGPVTVLAGADEAARKRLECWPDSQIRAGWDYLVRRTASA